MRHDPTTTMTTMYDEPWPFTTAELRAIPDADLDQLAEQAGEIQAEQAGGFGYDLRTMRWASQVAGEWTRRAKVRRLRQQVLAEERARYPRRAWGVLSRRLARYNASNPAF